MYSSISSSPIRILPECAAHPLQYADGVGVLHALDFIVLPVVAEGVTLPDRNLHIRVSYFRQQRLSSYRRNLTYSIGKSG